VFIGGPWQVDNFNIDPREQHGRRADHRVMGGGKTEDAMVAARMNGSAIRCVRRGSAVVTQFESRQAFLGVRGNRQRANRNEQSLRGDGIGDDYADQRSPQPPGLFAKSQHAAAHHAIQIMKACLTKVNAAILERI